MPTIHDVSFHYDYPHSLARFSNNRTFGNYLILREEILYDHRHPPKLENLYAESKWSFEEWTMEELKCRAQRDGLLMLEYCMRRIAPCNLRSLCPPGIMEDLKALAGLLDEPNDPRHEKPPELKVRALAMLVWLFFRMYFTSRWPDTLQALRKNKTLITIVQFADLCAVSDFLPPIVIRVAGWLTSMQGFYGIDLRGLEAIASYKFVWEAYEEFVQRQDSKELRRLSKAAGAPNLYRCAADGCGIQVFKRGALRKCGGECPPESKPHYCSLQCQRKHWFVHQYVCTAEAAAHAVQYDDGNSDWVDEEVYQPQYPAVSLRDREVWRKDEGWELFVDIIRVSPYRQTEVFRIRSRNLSPAFLRSYRDLWQLPLRSRKKMMAKLLRTPESIIDPW